MLCQENFILKQTVLSFGNDDIIEKCYIYTKCTKKMLCMHNIFEKK